MSALRAVLDIGKTAAMVVAMALQIKVYRLIKAKGDMCLAGRLSRIATGLIVAFMGISLMEFTSGVAGGSVTSASSNKPSRWEPKQYKLFCQARDAGIGIGRNQLPDMTDEEFENWDNLCDSSSRGSGGFSMLMIVLSLAVLGAQVFIDDAIHKLNCGGSVVSSSNLELASQVSWISSASISGIMIIMSIYRVVQAMPERPPKNEGGDEGTKPMTYAPDKGKEEEE